MTTRSGHPPRPEDTRHPYVTRQPGVCGGKAIIAGTRIKVSQIALEYDVMGWTADEIVQAHPHLTLPQIHDALSFYYENAAEIHSDMRAGEAAVDTLRQQQPASVLKRKRGDA
jgi:uncharacterized protein (DUF433 family)